MAAEAAGNELGSEGMVSYLTAQAKENPAAFMALLGRTLPKEHGGLDGEPIKTVHTIRIVTD